LGCNDCAAFESQIREIMRCQSPQLIVVELSSFLYDVPVLHIDPATRMRYLHNIPFSWNKVKSIFELIPAEERYYYFFPLAKYHSAWKDVPNQLKGMQSQYEIKAYGTKLKGMTNAVTGYSAESPTVLMDMSRAPMEPSAEQILRSFLAFCQAEGIEDILFVYFPHVINSEASYSRYQRGNEAQRIIEDQGYPVINMERNPYVIGLDFQNDFSDEEHLNSYGQKKLTKYLGEVLVEEYGVTGRQLTDEQRENWNTAAWYMAQFYEYAHAYEMAGWNNAYFYETTELIETLTAYDQTGVS